MASVVERSFVKHSLLQGFRVDHRKAEDHRDVHFEFGKDRGHVIVHLGDTKVLAVVTAQVSRPFPDRPIEGMIGIFVDSLDAEWNDSSESLAVNRLLEKLFKSSRTIDTESLCILPGEQVWSLRLDVHVLDACGNVTDAASLAALAALLDFRRPDSTVIDGKAVIYTAFQKHPVPLTIQHRPISITFGVFDVSEGQTSSHSNTVVKVAADPSAVEEQVAIGGITLSVNRQGEIVSLIKLGGPGLQPEVIYSQCLDIAKARAVIFDDLLTTQLAERK